jgi:hypothetical protein
MELHGAPDKLVCGKRNKGTLADDEIVAFTSMIYIVKDVTRVIRDNKSTDMHPNLYNVVMDIVGITKESLMAALIQLVDNKAHGTCLVGLAPPHMILWLGAYVAKY